jgi:tripeptide aminopeptidase
MLLLIRNQIPNDTKYSKNNLANQLVEELKNIGMQDVTIDDKSYIMATLPSNVDHEVPTIGFVSHFDTT